MADPVKSWITISDLKDALDLDASVTTRDGRIEWIIDGVCRAIEDFCGRTFVAEDATELYDGDGTDTLLVHAPIIKVTALLSDTVALTVTTDFVVYASIGKIRLVASVFPVGIQNVSVTYRHGWELGKIPASIKSAALMWGCKRYLDLKDNRVGVSSVSYSDQTIGFSGQIPPEIVAMIEPYRMLI